LLNQTLFTSNKICQEGMVLCGFCPYSFTMHKNNFRVTW
jgi:hypothetical protein